MKFETTAYADVSTAYLEPSDLELILDCEMPGHCFNHDEMVASIFSIPQLTESWTEYTEAWKAKGLSERFLSIMTALREQYIQYVRFDACGGDIDGLEPCDHESSASLDSSVSTD